MKIFILIVAVIASADIYMIWKFYKKDVIDFVEDEETFEQQEVNLDFINEQLKIKA